MKIMPVLFKPLPPLQSTTIRRYCSRVLLLSKYHKYAYAFNKNVTQKPPRFSNSHDISDAEESWNSRTDDLPEETAVRPHKMKCWSRREPVTTLSDGPRQRCPSSRTWVERVGDDDNVINSGLMRWEVATTPHSNFCYEIPSRPKFAFLNKLSVCFVFLSGSMKTVGMSAKSEDGWLVDRREVNEGEK